MIASDAVPTREIENVFIPMSDGTQLAARIWLPQSADDEPVPAILEYIPYRKRDFMRLRDEPMHRYYAAHGYAAVRLDLRGSGDSDGTLADEYLPQEQQDAIEAIEWLTQQPWCNGSVGMTGISWGGFNALQVAAHRPKALKAILTLCASDDRYADDAHYMGGCLLNENQIWGTVLFGLNALPPDPEVVGERWRAMWLARLHANKPFPAHWLRHQRRDSYWQQGSVCEDFARITCPVYAIGGWADGYSNAVPRLLAGLSGPRKGLIGPWSHSFPHNGFPGPAIGYLQEAVRWWDHWLKGRDTGIMQEPMLRAWMQDYAAPAPFYAERAGRWVAEPSWPVQQPASQRLFLTGGGTLAERPGVPAVFSTVSPQTTGLGGGSWCGFGSEGDAPLDQRPDDGRSLCFDSEPLTADLEILGVVTVTLVLRSDRPVANCIVRLNEIAPDGSSARVTFGVLNLTHRVSHAQPTPLSPGETFTVAIDCNAIAHRFSAGHVVRVAISNTYWPMIWPAPEPVQLEVLTDNSWLDLPVRLPNPADATLRPFEPAESADSTSTLTPLVEANFTRTVSRNLTNKEVQYRMISEGGDLDAKRVRIEDINMELGHHVERHFLVDDQDPLRAETEIVERMLMRRDNWEVRVRARTQMRATREHFVVDSWLEAEHDGNEVFRREWHEEIERDLL